MRSRCFRETQCLQHSAFEGLTFIGNYRKTCRRMENSSTTSFVSLNSYRLETERTKNLEWYLSILLFFSPRYGLSLKRQKNRLAKYERSSHVSINWLRTLEITRKNNFWLLNVKCLLKSNKQMYLLYVASILQIKNWGGSLEGIGWKNEKKIMTSSSTATNKRKGKIKGVPH